MRTPLRNSLILVVALSAAVACGRSEPDKADDDLDIGDIGDFSDGGAGDDGGSGSGSDVGGGSDGADDGGSGTGSSTGGGSGTDDGGDGGEDDGVGTGGGTGSTEPPTPEYAPDSDAPCFDGLSFEVQMLDTVSGSCVECASGADHWVAATIYNPCPVDYSVTLYDGILMGGMELVNHTTGEGMGMSSGSTGRVEVETLAPGEWLSETMYMGTLSDGDYDLSITFFDEAGTHAGLEFSVW